MRPLRIGSYKEMFRGFRSMQGLLQLFVMKAGVECTTPAFVFHYLEQTSHGAMQQTMCFIQEMEAMTNAMIASDPDVEPN